MYNTIMGIISLIILLAVIFFIYVVLSSAFKFKDWEYKDKIKLFIAFLILMFVIIFIMPVMDYHDCYDAYVEECNECHSKGGAYSLCSGMCYFDINESYSCVTALDKKCEDNIPKRYCVLEGYTWCLGMLKLWCI